MAELEEKMRFTTPTSLDRVTAARNGFTAVLDTVYNEANDSVKQDAMIEEFGKQLRSITLG